MPYLFIQLNEPLVPQTTNTFPVDIGYSSDKIRSVKLIQYSAQGLADTTPFIFKVKDQGQTPVYGNVTTSDFPLLWGSFPNDHVSLQTPIEIMGDSYMSGAAKIVIELRSVIPLTIPIFSKMWLLFYVNYLTEPIWGVPTKQEYSFLQH